MMPRVPIAQDSRPTSQKPDESVMYLAHPVSRYTVRPTAMSDSKS